MTTSTFPSLSDYISAADLDTLTGSVVGRYHDKELLQATLERVYEAICPWPAVKVRDAWWFTLEGSVVANCQWILYEEEAVELPEAAKLLQMTRSGVSAMIRRGELRAYRLPDEKLLGRPINGRNGFPENPWYVRLSELRRHYE